MYLKGTYNMCLCYGGANPVLEGYTGTGMTENTNSRKSTSYFLYTFARKDVSWQSRFLSTIETWYTIAAKAKKMLRLKQFFQEPSINQEDYEVHCNNERALDLSKNSMYHSRMKHIDIRYHWIREVINQQLLRLIKIHWEENPSDMLIKMVTLRKDKIMPRHNRHELRMSGGLI